MITVQTIQQPSAHPGHLPGMAVNVNGPQTRQQKRMNMIQAERDLELAIASHYDPIAFGTLAHIPVNDILRHRISETRQTQQQRDHDNVIVMNWHREHRAGTGTDYTLLYLAFAGDAQKRLQEWLKAEHSLGPVKMAGRKWAELAEYIKNDELKVRQQLLKRGYDEHMVDRRMQVFEIMGRGPQNDIEKTALHDARLDPVFTSYVGFVVDQSGVLKAKEPAPAPRPSHGLAHDLEQMLNSPAPKQY